MQVGNFFESLDSKLNELLKEVRTLNARTNAPPPDEHGGWELWKAVTGLSQSTGYKLVCFRKVPHSKVGGRIRFTRAHLEAWMEEGRRPLAKDIAHERMSHKK